MRERGAGLFMLILLAALVGAVVYSLSALKGSQVRLYRFTDGAGNIQYVDSLDKVPSDQRAEAEAQPDAARITKGDYQAFADKVAESAKRSARN